MADDESSGAGGAGTVMLDALFTQAPIGLAVLDGDLRVVRINTATPAMQGSREEDVIRRTFPASHYVVDAAAAEALVREAMESGVSVRGLLRARPPAHHGQERLYEFAAFRLLAPGGEVLGACITVVDVTDRERALSRLRLLDTVRERVGRSLEMVMTCQELADAVVPEFADVAVVELVETVICGDDPPSPLPSCVVLRRVAFRSSAGKDAPQAHPVGHVEVLP